MDAGCMKERELNLGRVLKRYRNDAGPLRGLGVPDLLLRWIGAHYFALYS